MNQSEPLTIFIVLLLFVLSSILFAGLWCAIALAISKVGGWRRLAEHFPARSRPSGRRFFMQSGKIGRAAYKGCLIIHSSPEGLHLSVLLPFRPGHPPFFIPWDAVRNATTHRFLWIKGVTFDAGSPSVATLQLPEKVFAGYFAYAP